MKSNTVIFSISPLIRITLFFLYITLTIPLPFLAEVTAAPVPPYLLWLGIGLGAIAVWAALSEKVILSEEGIQVTYPQWIGKIFRRGWSLKWEEIKDLKMRTTGQGGLVYYFTTQAGDRAYLLPMRVAGFAKMVSIVEQKTQIDTTDIRPLSQPWMYFTLLIFTFCLFLIDIWTINTAINLGLI